MSNNTICPICSKELPPKPIYGDCCERGFCSEECGQIDHYENTFPNCCPGVYWCIICRDSYLNEAKGHLFLIKNHNETPDLLKYGGERVIGGAFMEMCMKCNMWNYEFRSFTDEKSIYEDQSCGNKIREDEE